MKKLLICVSLLLVLVFAVVACKTNSGKNEDTTVKSEVTKESDTTVKGSDDTTVKEGDDTTVKDDGDDTTVKDDDNTSAKEEDTTEEETTEEITKDPDEPVAIFTPEDIKNIVDENPKVGNGIAGVKTDSVAITDNYITLVASGDDPHMDLYMDGNNPMDGARYLAIKYRTTVASRKIEVFIATAATYDPANGNSQTPAINDGEWHLLIIDLDTLSAVENYKIGAIRFDFLQDTVADGDSIDIQFFAFFNSEEAAKKYAFKPAAAIDAEGLKENADLGDNAHVSQMEYTVKGDYITLKSTGGDPYIVIINLGSSQKVNPKGVIAVKYRTNWEKEGEFFIGNGSGWHGGTDEVKFKYTADNEWHILFINIEDCQEVEDTIAYLRWDFFAGDGGNSYMDVQYVGVFDSMSDALGYDALVNPDTSKYTSKEDAGFVKSYINTATGFSRPDPNTIPSINNQLKATGYTLVNNVGNVAVSGWAGFSSALSTFGYAIDNGDVVWVDGSLSPAESDAIKGPNEGGENAVMFAITFPSGDLEEGFHSLKLIAKLENGMEVCLYDFTYEVKPSNALLTVDFDTLEGKVSGHGGLFKADGTKISGAASGEDSAVAGAAGVTSSYAKIHKGSINLGTLDLSKYTYVEIKYGYDGSPVTEGHYNSATNKRIGLTECDKENVDDPFSEKAIWWTDYEFSTTGWSAHNVAKIDLSGCTYNGEVFVSLDSLPGTFYVIDSIVFYGLAD